MPQVTAIRAQQRRHDRVNIDLDGVYAFSLQRILAAELTQGQELSAAEIAALQARDLVERAYERALRYLGYRPRSAEEVRRYLQDKGAPPQVVDQVIERLQRVRLLDDAAFAEFWVENREAFRPKGAWALQGELRQKGIAPEVIAAAVSDVDEEASAMRAATQALRRYARLDRETFLRRMLGYLQRRGFGYGLSRQVAERVWAQAQAERDP